MPRRADTGATPGAGAATPGTGARAATPGARAATPGDVERVFREEYGRAVAVLVRVFGDIDVAEEAVQEAFTAAVQRWPGAGVPPSPAGWIITTARNRAIDRLRKDASREDRQAQAALLHATEEPAEEGPVRDDRLRLIFTCCHAALAMAAQVALTLRTLVRACLRRNQPGPYQIQAAINAVHSDAPTAAATSWPQILRLYDQLMAQVPSPVVALHRAVAVAEVDGPGVALQLIDELDLGSYHLFHAIRADLLRRLDRPGEADQAYRAAIAATGNAAERDFLERRRRSLMTTEN